MTSYALSATPPVAATLSMRELGPLEGYTKTLTELECMRVDLEIGRGDLVSLIQQIGLIHRGLVPQKNRSIALLEDMRRLRAAIEANPGREDLKCELKARNIYDDALSADVRQRAVSYIDACERLYKRTDEVLRLRLRFQARMRELCGEDPLTEPLYSTRDILDHLRPL